MKGIYVNYIKRLLDILLFFIALLVLFFPITILMIFVKMKMGSPIFFTQDRPGLYGRIFRMYKFRTMTNECDPSGNLLPNEKRLTKFGKFLRSTSLDELPELFNVIIGDMSFVGPRPLRVEYLEHYNKEQAKRHDVKPGITGWAQVNGRNTIGWDERFKYDVWYVDNQSLWLDIRILWLTFIKVMRREGINSTDDKFVEPFKGVSLNG